MGDTEARLVRFTWKRETSETMLWGMAETSKEAVCCQVDRMGGGFLVEASLVGERLSCQTSWYSEKCRAGG